jgi:small subunit ribosomal protein S7
MPPRLNIWSACRALSIRTRAVAPGPLFRPAALARGLADNTTSRFPPSNDGALPPSMLPESQSASEPAASSNENEAALNQLRMIEYGIAPRDPAVEGHKYGLPELPIPSEKHRNHRYSEVIEQVTRLLMRDGKLAKAQRVSRENTSPSGPTFF